ncbi:MAG: sugar phosphate isomerase/epimerase [Nitrospirae bacterium]|nr:sugar phosphate isomerase/epimerase [Nitrospirota bacterium]MCL5237355.1 sugar phosphate isomerase/epimerase [Nitrospirota bacterium]
MTAPHIHVPYENIGDHIQFILDNKLNLEIYFNAETLDSLSTDSVRALRATLAYKPSLSFHAPFMDLCPGAVDSRIRGITVERFNRTLDLAELLKPACIVFHSGYEKWKYALQTDLWLRKSLETWQPLNERAEKLGVKIAIENIFEDEPSNLKLLAERMISGNFGICFDAGHCNLFSAVPMSTWLEDLKPYIIELHIHDNDKSADQHLPIGDGNVDFHALFAAVNGKDCVYTIEAHNPEDVLKSIERLKAFTS